MTPTLSFKFVGSTSLRLLTGCSVEPHQPYGVLVASTKGFTNESIKWYCYQWCPSLPLQGVTEARFIILLSPGLLEEKFRNFFFWNKHHQGVYLVDVPQHACIQADICQNRRHATRTLGLAGDCLLQHHPWETRANPRFFCAEMLLLILTWPNAHGWHRNTTNWSAFSHVISSNGSTLFKGRPPKKHTTSWVNKAPSATIPLQATSIHELPLLEKLDWGTPHQVVFGTAGQPRSKALQIHTNPNWVTGFNAMRSLLVFLAGWAHEVWANKQLSYDFQPGMWFFGAAQSVPVFLFCWNFRY